MKGKDTFGMLYGTCVCDKIVVVALPYAGGRGTERQSAEVCCSVRKQ